MAISRTYMKACAKLGIMDHIRHWTITGLSAVALWLTASLSASALEATAPSDVSPDEPVQADPRIGYYSSETISRGFILDRSGEVARMRFDNTKEILLLDMVPGPRGDTFLKDETGRTILRIMPFGGATYYGNAAAVGVAFGRTKSARQLAMLPRSKKDVEDQLVAASQLMSLRFGMSIQFVTDWSNVPIEDAAVSTLGDAVDNTASALVGLAREDIARDALGTQLTLVEFVSGERKQILLDGARLVIYFDPAGGLEGRPSSRAIFNFLQNSL